MKKDAYLTEKKFVRVTRSIYHQALKYGPARRFDIKAESSVFLIMDMQKYFLLPESAAFIPSSIPLLKRIRAFQQFCIRKEIPVFFTRHVNTAENAGMMDVRWNRLMREEDPLTEISDSLDSGESPVIIKSQYDAFYNTDLKERLDNLKVRVVIIGGVMTHLCCETTARSAFIHGFQPILPVDLTATIREELHRATAVNLAHGIGGPYLTQEIIDCLEKK